MLPLYEVLYVSAIAPATPVQHVSQIAVNARANNQRLGVTGLLVFDGIRFWQHLEGPPKEVKTLLERIQKDPRHINVQVLHQAESAERRFKRFSMGYAAVDNFEELAEIERLKGSRALDKFLALRRYLDLDN